MPLSRRAFVATLLAGAAAAPLLWAWARSRPDPHPVYLARGQGGVWGFSDDPADAEGVVTRGPRGVLGVEPAPTANLAPARAQAPAPAPAPWRSQHGVIGAGPPDPAEP